MEGGGWIFQLIAVRQLTIHFIRNGSVHGRPRCPCKNQWVDPRRIKSGESGDRSPPNGFVRFLFFKVRRLLYWSAPTRTPSFYINQSDNTAFSWGTQRMTNDDYPLKRNPKGGNDLCSYRYTILVRFSDGSSHVFVGLIYFVVNH